MDKTLDKTLGIIKSVRFGYVDNYKTPQLTLEISALTGTFFECLDCIKYEHLIASQKIENINFLVGKPAIIESTVTSLHRFVGLFCP